MREKAQGLETCTPSTDRHAHRHTQTDKTDKQSLHHIPDDDGDDDDDYDGDDNDVDGDEDDDD